MAGAAVTKTRIGEHLGTEISVGEDGHFYATLGDGVTIRKRTLAEVKRGIGMVAGGVVRAIDIGNGYRTEPRPALLEIVGVGKHGRGTEFLTRHGAHPPNYVYRWSQELWDALMLVQEESEALQRRFSALMLTAVRLSADETALETERKRQAGEAEVG